jgi:hypothetical protein
MIDARGRLFRRFNIVDLLMLVFVAGLVPVAYATYLLFRPAAPVIASVERVEITREERRIAGGSLLTAKLKVRGSGFSPMLRARLNDTPAIGFIFENPNSADVVVGELPPGTFDLVLVDGVQEVARARNALTVTSAPAQYVRTTGRFVDLSNAQAAALRVGDTYPPDSPQLRVLALGDTTPGSARVVHGARVTDVATPDRFEREAAVALRCDPRADEGACAVNGTNFNDDNTTLTLNTSAGTLRFTALEVFPDAAPEPMQIVVRATGGAELRSVKAGATDALLDERAAVVTALSPVATANGLVTVDIALRLGADASREGWRYRGRLLTPGSRFTLTLPSAVIDGIVQSAVKEQRVNDQGR